MEPSRRSGDYCDVYEGGTYTDPVAGQGLTGEALTGYAKEMWGAFPDLSFEIVTLATAGKDMVAAQ